MPIPADISGSELNSIFTYLFEIQIRTAFEHAWSVATHDLTYKSSIFDWRRLRLAAQLKASTEMLDASINAFQPFSEVIERSPWRRHDDIVSLHEFLEESFSSGAIPEILRPLSTVRFCENVRKLISAIRPKLSVTEAIVEIKANLSENESNSLPLSLSLYQIILSILLRNETRSMETHLPCHVTFELSTLYPATKAIEGRFDYNS